MPSQIAQKIRFVSRPSGKNFGAPAMMIGLVLASILLGAAVWVGVWQMQSSILLGALTLLCTASLALYLLFLVYRSSKENSASELILEDETITLSSFAQNNKIESTQIISLDEIRVAEYYPSDDSGSILLRSSATDLDIPICLFGRECESQLIDFLRANGIRVVEIPIRLRA